MNPEYLDCNATAPLEPRVLELTIDWLARVGNAGSRTHDYGGAAKRAVGEAREQVAAVVGASPEEVIFTSGATEANNIALLGSHSLRGVERRHAVSTQIEHKAVLEPLARLEETGAEITLLRPNSGGWVEPEAVRAALRPDTKIVSVMHVNNETGVVQPLAEIAEVLRDHDALFHVDAAQGFGKLISDLQEPRIDLISVSGHKIYGPQGIGALVARRRGYQRLPAEPIAFGGGQEHGIRPGTLPVALIAGFGLSAELSLSDSEERAKRCAGQREKMLSAFRGLTLEFHGDQERVLPHTVNFSIPGLDAEAAIIALKDLVAVSNGSACTSQSYSPSHVLEAMGIDQETIEGALRFSWCHLTEEVDWESVAARLQTFC